MKILITGGTHGMGKGVAKALAKADNKIHEIIILCRSKKLGDLTIEEFKHSTLNNKVTYVLCDLAKLSDVKRAVQEIKNKHSFLDGVFINAGLGYAAKRVETIDGMDSHFQINYLSQFMLTLNLLSLLEKSKIGGRIIFNVTEGGKINWDDMQMEHDWSYENGIHQAMVAKRMFLTKLHTLYRKKSGLSLSFVGFQIPKTVWTNQITIIPPFMKFMATIVKFFGGFITIDECGKIIAPLFTEKQKNSLHKSGKFITWKNDQFVEIKDDADVLNIDLQDKLWNMSLILCRDKKTVQISKLLCR